MDFQVVDGIRCYAPEVAHRHDNFPAEEFVRIHELEERNFWYRSRSRIIQHFIERYVSRSPARFLEIGCGAGCVLKDLSRFPNLRLTGAEIYLSGLRLARQRLPGTEFLQLDATRMPFNQEFDAIGIFDTLEHIPDDPAVLKSASQALKPGGYLLVTVPQHKFLWSANDEASHHQRRYSRRELEEKTTQAGLKPIFTTSFLWALFPAMAAVRILRGRTPAADPYTAVLRNLDLPVWLNGLLGIVTRIDESLIRVGIRLPYGGSLFMIAQKPEA